MGHMRDWRYRRVLRSAVLPVFTVILVGCVAATGTSTEQASADDKVIASDVSVDASAGFITEGKPTKTIETPWGPREIYDPAQDEKFRAIFKNWFDVGFKGYDPYQLCPENLSDTNSPLSNGSYFSESMRLVEIDYLRSGCALTVQGTCFYNEYIFKSDCKADHNFGSLDLSKCEIENITYLSVGNGVAGGCPFKGKRLHFGNSFRKEADFELSLTKFTEFECRIWRDEPRADYWKDLVPDPMRPRP